MMKCINCRLEISAERLDILPDTKFCVTCVKGREPAINKVIMNQLDPQPYIEAKVPYIGMFRRSLRKVSSKIKIIKHRPPTTLGDIAADNLPHPRMKNIKLVPVTFDAARTYHLRIHNFQKKSKLNYEEVIAAIEKGYEFTVVNDILYMDKLDGEGPRKLCIYKSNARMDEEKKKHAMDKLNKLTRKTKRRQT